MEIETGLQLLSEYSRSDDKIELIESILKFNEPNEIMLQAMVDLLGDDDPWLKDYIARYLSELVEPKASIAAKVLSPLVLTTKLELRNLAGDLLIRLGKPSGAFMIEYLRSDDIDVRKFACDILGLVDTRELNIHILPLLDDADDNVVQSAIEALGNYQDETSIAKLIELYNVNPEHKAIIIEALGKIGSLEAMNHLLHFLDIEQDEFLQSAIIDSLALNCEDIEIANSLFETIEKASPQIQIIILKTVSAIAFRLDVSLVLPDSLRPLSYKALFDNDPDLRAAGLLSLGYIYRSDDFPSLFNEIFNNNADTQSLILERLLLHNSPQIIREFFKAFCHSSNLRSSISCDIDFISLMSYLWNEVTETNKIEVISVIIDTLFTCKQSDFDTTFELLIKLDTVRTNELLNKFYNRSSRAIQLLVEDVVRNYQDDIKLQTIN